MSIVTGISAIVSNDKYSFESVTPVFDSYYSKVTGTTHVVSQWACEVAAVIPASASPINAGFRLVVPSTLRATNFLNAYQIAGSACLHIGTDTVMYGFVKSVPGAQTMWVDFIDVPTQLSVTTACKIRVSTIVLGT